MNVRSILEHKGRAVAIIRPEAGIEEAVALLRHRERRRAGGQPRPGDRRRHHFRTRHRPCLAEWGTDIGGMRVATLMSRDVVTCGRGDSIGDLARLMTERRIRHVPVVERGALAGIVSIGDVVKGRIAEVESESEAMRELIARA